MRRLILEFEDDKAADELADVLRQMTQTDRPDARGIPVTVVDIFAGNTRVRLVESSDLDFGPFGLVEPTLANALARRGWASVAALECLTDGWGAAPWEVMLGMPNVGPRRVLALVNWLRDSGVELSWLAAWDEMSVNLVALKGCRRADPPGNP